MKQSQRFDERHHEAAAKSMSSFGSNAALVVAHPDDEALWFSSVLTRVDKIVICYQDLEGSDLGQKRTADG